jgi:hypothetical protein
LSLLSMKPVPFLDASGEWRVANSQPEFPFAIRHSPFAISPSVPVLAMRFRTRALLNATKSLPKKLLPSKQKGGGAPKGAPRCRIEKRCGARPVSVPQIRTGGPRPLAASWRGRARLSAPHRGTSPGFWPGSALGPRFLESPDASGRTLSGTSAASTSRSDTRRTGRCPSRP